MITDIADTPMDKEGRCDRMIAAEPVSIGIRDPKPFGGDRVRKSVVRVEAVVALLGPVERQPPLVAHDVIDL